MGDKKKGHEPSVEEQFEALEQRLAELLEQLEAELSTGERGGAAGTWRGMTPRRSWGPPPAPNTQRAGARRPRSLDPTAATGRKGYPRAMQNLRTAPRSRKPRLEGGGPATTPLARGRSCLSEAPRRFTLAGEALPRRCRTPGYSRGCGSLRNQPKGTAHHSARSTPGTSRVELDGAGRVWASQLPTMEARAIGRAGSSPLSAAHASARGAEDLSTYPPWETVSTMLS